MKNYDGIIFDIDGTLTSTNELIFESFRYVYKKYFNKHISDEEIIALFGPTEDVILQQWGGDRYDEIRHDYYSFYSSNHHMADLYPGMIDILKFIKSENLLLSVFTGKGRESATITLNKLGIYNLFDFIITGDDVKEHKPSAEGIIKFVKEFNLNAERVLMVGDSPVDIKASRSAGVKIASVIWDSYSKEQILKLGSDFLFDNIKDFEKFIHDNIE